MAGKVSEVFGREVYDSSGTGVGPFLPVAGVLLGSDGTPVEGRSSGASSDASSNKPTLASLGTLLATVVADPTRAGMWFCMNCSAATIYLVFDDGSDGSETIIPVASSDIQNNQGGSISDLDLGLFKGRIRVYGAAGSWVALRVR